MCFFCGVLTRTVSQPATPCQNSAHAHVFFCAAELRRCFSAAFVWYRPGQAKEDLSTPSGAASGADAAQGQGLQPHNDTSGGGDAEDSGSQAQCVSG